MPVAIVANRTVFWRVVYSFLVVELVSFTAFVVYPVEMTLRATDLPAETFAGWALTMCYSIDRPFNCFPSLHVGNATVGALCTWKVDKLVGTLGLIAAALDGIERRLEPEPLFNGDAYGAEDLPRVPQTLPEAIEAFAASDFLRGAFGDAVIEHLAHFARAEQATFDRTVTDFEKVRYFERI